MIYITLEIMEHWTYKGILLDATIAHFNPESTLVKWLKGEKP